MAEEIKEKEEVTTKVSAVDSSNEASSVEEAIKVRKGKKRADIQGIATIRATFNNTIISMTDVRGNVISWCSPGNVGFKGSRKSTPFAAQLAAEEAAKKAFDLGMRKVDVRVKGAGSGRESAIRALKSAGMEILTIRDLTGVPHNGCRPKKKRRI